MTAPRYRTPAALAAAIKRAGSVRKLAEQLGVTSQAIYQMRKRASKRKTVERRVPVGWGHR